MLLLKLTTEQKDFLFTNKFKTGKTVNSQIREAIDNYILMKKTEEMKT